MSTELAPTSAEFAGHEDLLRGFLQQGTSRNTREARARDLGIPLTWVPGRPEASPRKGPASRGPSGLAWLHWCLQRHLPLAGVRVRHVEQWLDDLDQAGYHRTSRGRMLSTVSKFYRYLLREEHVSHNPAELVDRRAQHLNRRANEPSATSAVPFAACRALLEAAWLLTQHHQGQRGHPHRDRAMVEILVTTGIRVDELVTSTLEDYARRHPGAGAVLTVHGKGDRDRRVALAEPVATTVDEYLARRIPAQVPARPGQLGRPAPAPLFASDHGRRLAHSHVTRMLRRICATFTPTLQPSSHRHRALLATERAAVVGAELRRIRDTISPHQLRHSYATYAAARGIATRQIKIDLGHQSESTTEGYIRDDHGTAHSAVHELSPALHRGWLAERTGEEHT